MVETKIRQSENKIKIEGILSSMNLEEKQINGQTAITGELVIKTDELSEHKVSVFSFKYKKNSQEISGVYKGLKTVMNEYKTIQDYGKDEADRVRITRGQYGLNEYYNPNGDLVSFPKITTNFINRLKPSEKFEPHAKFELDVYITNISDEIKNEEETGRKIIKGYIIDYNGKALPVELVAEDKEVIDYIESDLETDQTVWFEGDIINKTEKIVKRKKGAVGRGTETVSTNYIREMVIRTIDYPYTEESGKAYTKEQIKQALVERELYLDELKEKSKQNSTSSRAGAVSSRSFSSVSSSSNILSDIDDDEIPF